MASLALAACGGRTSVLDPEFYETGGATSGISGGTTSLPRGGSGTTSSGGPSHGGTGAVGTGAVGTGAVGTGAVGTGASTGTGATGSAGNGTVDPALSATACQRYCPGYGHECRSKLEGRDCVATCEAELNGYGPTCQAIGLDALECLTPFFSTVSEDCSGATRRALASCGDTTVALKSCEKDPSSFTPSPIAACPHMGTVTSPSCVDTFNCANGPFITFCSPTPGTNAFLDCTCIGPVGPPNQALLPTTASPCVDATRLCR